MGVLYPLIREHFTSQQGCAPGSETSSSSTLLRGYYTFNDAHKIIAYESEYYEAPQGSAATNLVSMQMSYTAWPSFLGGIIVGAMPFLLYFITNHRRPQSALRE